MPVFPKPKFAFEYDLNAEVARLCLTTMQRSFPSCGRTVPIWITSRPICVTTYPTRAV